MIIPSPTVEWSVLYTRVYNNQVHIMGNVNANTHHHDHTPPSGMERSLRRGANSQVHRTGNVTFDASCIKSAACSVLSPP